MLYNASEKEKNMFKNKKIVIGVSGGIASYKVASLVSVLHKEGASVQVIMTKHATQFISPLTLQTLSKNKVIVDMFEEDNAEYVGHIHFGQDCDLIVIVPATANIIGKAANGIADDMLTSTIIAANKPIIFVPSMNEVMYQNPIVQDNIAKLQKYGYHFLQPDNGMLACGVIGKGKLPKTELIIEEMKKVLKEGK